MKQQVVATNNRVCPVCGSETKRNKTDNRHNVYKEEHTCTNQQCAVSVIFRN